MVVLRILNQTFHFLTFKNLFLKFPNFPAARALVREVEEVIWEAKPGFLASCLA